MKKQYLIIVTIVAMFLSSCSSKVMDFTSLSPTIKPKFEVMGVKVTGSGGTINKAVTNALKKAGPDYDVIVDGSIHVDDYIFYMAYTIEGTACSSKQLKCDLGTQYDAWAYSHIITH